MTSEQNQTPFGELPGALVEEMLNRSEQIGNDLYESYSAIQQRKESIKKQLIDSNFLQYKSEFGNPRIPTTCGVDGAKAIERLLSMDFAACAAVGVEGITPPAESRTWECPTHDVFISPLLHHAANPRVIGGKMLSMETILASNAPHDLVFLDGSFTTALIHVNAAVSAALESNDTILKEIILTRFEEFLQSYKLILKSSRTDKIYASLPKYTTKRELGEKFNWPKNFDDRAVLTTILRPGEMIKPTSLKQDGEWHLKSESTDLDDLISDVIEALKEIHVLYYRPNPWTPVLRIEVAKSIADNPSRLAVLLQGIEFQCGAPGIIEPYPLFIADRMVKNLSTGLSAIRQCSTNQMVELDTSSDLSDIFFMMHEYRT
jgi:hypothetical protein